MPNKGTNSDLDEIDVRILVALQRNGRLSNLELAEKVGLSASPCLRRVKLLEESGTIKRYVALVDAAKIGMGLTLFVRVWLTRQDDDTLNQFIEKIKRFPQVLECYVIVGDCDFLLRVVAEDLNDYRRFQSEQLTRIKCVQNVKTEIPSQIVKLTTELPVK